MRSVALLLSIIEERGSVVEVFAGRERKSQRGERETRRGVHDELEPSRTLFYSSPSSQASIVRLPTVHGEEGAPQFAHGLSCASENGDDPRTTYQEEIQINQSMTLEHITKVFLFTAHFPRLTTSSHAHSTLHPPPPFLRLLSSRNQKPTKHGNQSESSSYSKSSSTTDGGVN